MESLLEKRAERNQLAGDNINNDTCREYYENLEWEGFWKSRGLNLLLYSCKHGTVDVVKFFVSIGVSPAEERSVYIHV